MTKEEYMRIAINEAKKYLGYVNPNPPVGAVIVKNEKILSVGAHKKFGFCHAEIDAISQLTDEELENSTLYVTLEPCCHFGKTPPCVDTIIAKKIGKVIVGTRDINPLVANKGIKILRDNGIEVEAGILEEECIDLIKVFKHSIENKKPFVAIKYAMTLDGKIASSSRDSKWISNDKSRGLVHQYRSEYKAIMVGINTILTDNPLLTNRYGRRNPIRIICDSHLRIPLDSNIVLTANEIETILVYVDDPLNKQEKLLDRHVKLLKVASDLDKKIDLVDMLTKLWNLGIDSIYVEGGSELITSFLKQKLANYIQVFISPKIIGGKDALNPVGELNIKEIKNSIQIKNPSYQIIEDNIFISGDLVY